MQNPWLKSYSPRVPAEIEFGGLTSISACFAIAFKKHARRPAATCLGITLTFDQLEQSLSSFASYLQNDLSIEKGDRIAIILPNCLQFLIAELAAFKIGAVCVNTNPMYTPRELKHQLQDSGASTVIILDLIAHKLDSVIDDLTIKNIIVTSLTDQMPSWKGLFAKQILKLKHKAPPFKAAAISFKHAMKKGDPKKLREIDVQLEDLALLQYTGGTTGVSKGAMLTHKNILANMLQIQAITKTSLQPGAETVLTVLPLYHIFALSVNLLTFLAEGQHLILVPNPNPIDGVAKLFQKYPISVMTGVNTLFNSFNNSKLFQKIAPKTLKVVVAGGMALQEHVNRKFQLITGVKITEGFGLTEASPVTHVNPIKEGNPVNSIGLPLPSTDAKIISDTGAILPSGEIGELIIYGPQVMKGYWNQPEETSKILMNGWLHTGDIARMDDRGYFYIVDRKKEMILVSGFNVYPNEIEAVIASHPKVSEVAVIGVPDKTSGEAVKAYIVPQDKSLTTEEIKIFCKAHLTSYKSPRHVEFLEQLPKSNVGKILRKDLRSLHNLDKSS